MQDHKRDMDFLEKNAMREVIRNYSLQGTHSVENSKRLTRLKDTAFFGRIDFLENTKEKPNNIYIGVLELGEAFYKVNETKTEGAIVLRRQFKIRNGEMEYMLDTDITIHDEVLQKELNKASSSKMKNIVATIQKEQNSIIRNEDARHLIIQGVAGSGKTSIALHRIAFLLYRFKETITSEDILIVSPNKVFASYISNVLPELGEESVAETSMEEIADELFDYQIKFQTFFEQVTELLEKNDQKLIERIQFKSSREILKKIDEYHVWLQNDALKITDIYVKGKLVPAWFIKETFEKYNRMPILKRFNEVSFEKLSKTFIDIIKKKLKIKTAPNSTPLFVKCFPLTILEFYIKDFTSG